MAAQALGHIEKSSPEPVAETMLDVETLVQDDSQMLVEDVQPRKLENMLEIQGADTVGSTTDYFVWFDLELGIAWRSSTGSLPEQAVTLQMPENARVWSLWSECGAMAGDMNLPTSTWTNTNDDAP